MVDLHKLENYDLDIINSWIQNELEESIHIEFKSSGALSKKDGDKKEISKDVSAFANSDGGIIVYGIEEKHHKAHSLSYIDGNTFTKEWLEQIITSTIQRNIEGLKIFPIRNNGKIEESIYVVQIPTSINAPHICKDKRFYYRHNFESVLMEEYEIRNAYGRKIATKLILSGYNIMLHKIEEDEIIIRIETGVINEGNAAEKDYKVNLIIEGFNENLQVNWRADGVGRNFDFTKMGPNGDIVKVTSGKMPILFPNERLNALRINMTVSKGNFRKALKDVNFKFHLFYSNGQDTLETKIIKLDEWIAMIEEHSEKNSKQ